MTLERTPGTGWTEVLLGGSQQSEDEMIRDWARRIVAVQHELAAKNGRPLRALHAKIVAAPAATFRIFSGGEINRKQLDDAGFPAGLPPELEAGIFAPGVRYDDVRVRLSNAAGVASSDEKRDLRGMAIRIRMSDGEAQDLLMTNMPASFARNPEQQVAVVEAGANRLRVPALFMKFGFRESIRILRAVKRFPPVDTLAAQPFWSRAPFCMGPYALKFKMQPHDVAPVGSVKRTRDFLREDLRARLARDEVKYDFCVQFFSDERTTPIEDGSVEWKTPFVTLGELAFPRQDLDSPSGQAIEAEVERWAFSPAHKGGLTGIGSLNRCRAAIYTADQKGRGASVPA